MKKPRSVIDNFLVRKSNIFKDIFPSIYVNREYAQIYKCLKNEQKER